MSCNERTFTVYSNMSHQCEANTAQPKMLQLNLSFPTQTHTYTSLVAPSVRQPAFARPKKLVNTRPALDIAKRTHKTNEMNMSACERLDKTPFDHCVRVRLSRRSNRFCPNTMQLNSVRTMAGIIHSRSTTYIKAHSHIGHNGRIFGHE